MFKHNKSKAFTNNLATFKGQRFHYHVATPDKLGRPDVFQNLWRISVFLVKATIKFIWFWIILFAAIEGKPKRYTADEAMARGGAGLNNTDFKDDSEYHRYRSLMRLDEDE